VLGFFLGLGAPSTAREGENCLWQFEFSLLVKRACCFLRHVAERILRACTRQLHQLNFVLQLSKTTGLFYFRFQQNLRSQVLQTSGNYRIGLQNLGARFFWPDKAKLEFSVMIKI
jgi:hypothetical protein